MHNPTQRITSFIPLTHHGAQDTNAQTAIEKEHQKSQALSRHREQCIPVSGVNYYLNSNHTKYLAQTLRPILYFLENFYHKFANLVAPPTDGTVKRLIRCKVHPVTDS